MILQHPNMCTAPGAKPVTPRMPFLPGCTWRVLTGLLLAVLSSAVEASVQEPDPFVKVLVILIKHSMTYNLLLADASL